MEGSIGLRLYSYYEAIQIYTALDLLFDLTLLNNLRAE
jgi:hypothetical protein